MGDVDAVLSILHTHNGTAASLVNEPSSMSTMLTPLHVACEHGDTALIEVRNITPIVYIYSRGF